MPDLPPQHPFLTLLAEGVRGLRRSAACLVAVSGGSDSVALLLGLHKLGFRRLCVCHLNHGLRPEAAEDALWVSHLASSWGLPFLCGQEDVRALAAERKLSLEEAGRIARRAFFFRCAAQTQARRLAVGHQRDDQAETILHNLLRGSGPKGLAGMQPRTLLHDLHPPARLWLLRPMLHIPRETARDWLTSIGQPWLEDATNLDTCHTRNKLRHQALPLLSSLMGRDVRATITRLGDILQTEEAFWERTLATLPFDCTAPTLPAKALAALHPALRHRAVWRWLSSHGIEPRYDAIEAVLRLLDTRSGPARVNLPGGCLARRRTGTIFLQPHLPSNRTAS